MSLNFGPLLRFLWMIFVLAVVLPTIIGSLYWVFRKGTRRLKRIVLSCLAVFYAGWFVFLWSMHLLPNVSWLGW